MKNLFFLFKVNYLASIESLHSSINHKMSLITSVISTPRVNKKVSECISIRMEIPIKENSLTVFGMESSSGTIRMEILTLENADGATDTAMAHYIGLVPKRHTLVSFKITKRTAMEF